MERQSQPFKPALSLILTAVVMLISNTGAALSCWYANKYPDQKELAGYSHVIEAQVIKIEFVDAEVNDNPTDGTDEMNVLVTVEIIRTWTPSEPKTFSFWTKAQDVYMEGGYAFVTGLVYVIFIREGCEFVTSCTRTQRASYSRELMEALTQVLGEPVRYKHVSNDYYQ